MLYEVESVRRLTGIGGNKVPDERTILNFLHLLEPHGLGKVLLESIKEHLAEQGLKLREGTILDGSIIAAPSSRKNRRGEGDSQMKQSSKGKQWYFGMKLHIGVEEQTALVDSLATSAANVRDLSLSEQLLHGEEVRLRADAGYGGIEKRPRHQDRQVAWHIAIRAGQGRKQARDQQERLMEQCKSGVRSKVEHVFFTVKQVFDYRKSR